MHLPSTTGGETPRKHPLAEDRAGTAARPHGGDMDREYGTAVGKLWESEEAETPPGGRSGPEPPGRHGRRLRGSHGPEADAAGAVVLVSEHQDLQDEVARLAAAAGVDISVARDISAALELGPEVILLGSDHWRMSGNGRGNGFGSGGFAGTGHGTPEVIVVGLAGDQEVWDAAAGSSAARVAVLPAAAGWLAGYLGRRRTVSGGTVLGIVGGCGGAGASTLACWLSFVAAEADISVLLVDGDPWGAGMDWALGVTEADGIRWPDLSGLSGSLNPVQLAAGLPAVGGFSLLSRGGGEPARDGDVAVAVMDAARGGFGLTIVDLGRWLGAESLLPFCDHLLVLVPGRPGGVLAARTQLPYLGHASARVVVRGPLAEGWDETQVADAVGLPLAGYLPRLRSAERNAESGRVLADSARRRIGRASRQILSEVLSTAVPAGSTA